MLSQIWIGWDLETLLLGIIPWDDIGKFKNIVFANEEELAPKAAEKVRVAIAKMFADFGLKANFKNLNDILLHHNGEFDDEKVDWKEPTGMYKICPTPIKMSQRFCRWQCFFL